MPRSLEADKRPEGRERAQACQLGHFRRERESKRNKKRDSSRLIGTEEIRDALIISSQALSAMVPTWMSGRPFPSSDLRDEVRGQEPVRLFWSLLEGHLWPRTEDKVLRH